MDNYKEKYAKLWGDFVRLQIENDELKTKALKTEIKKTELEAELEATRAQGFDYLQRLHDIKNRYDYIVDICFNRR